MKLVYLFLASVLFGLMLSVGAFAQSDRTADNVLGVDESKQAVAPLQTDTGSPQTTTSELKSAELPKNMPALSREMVLHPGTEHSSSASLLKIVISLTIVVAVVIGLGWMFKKLSLRMPGNRQIKVICALPLGQRERILVIEIQGKQRVIGVTAHNINFLFELENPLPEEKLALDFHTQLQSFLKK